MDKFDALRNKFMKNSETSVTPVKSKERKNDQSKSKTKVEKVSNIKQTKTDKSDRKMMDENLKLILNGEFEKRVTRSASKNAKSEKKTIQSTNQKNNLKSVKKNIIPEKSLQRSRTVDSSIGNKSAKKNNVHTTAQKNMTKNTNQNNKKEFVPKTTYLLNNKLKFKEDGKRSVSKNAKNDTQTNNLSNINGTNTNKIYDANTNKIKYTLKNKFDQNNTARDSKSNEHIDKKTKREKQEDEADNKFKNKYSFVKSKVKQFLKNQENIMKNEKVEENKNSDVEVALPKSMSVGKNYVRQNMKKGYQEHKLVRHKNIRRVKIDRSKAYYKFQNTAARNGDDKYLGRGKEGLDTELIIEGEDADMVNINSANNNIEENLALLKGVQFNQNAFDETSMIAAKVPYFSEGYFNNALEETRSAMKSMQGDEDINLIIENNHQNNNQKNDFSSIKPPRPGNTPLRLMTNKLTSALKSSFKKKVPLDTELKILSKEFRFLLSGKKKEAEEYLELVQKEKENVEKKLNFNDKEEDKMIIDEVPENSSENEDDLSEGEVEKLENDILLKVLDENFGFQDFRPGQLQTIKNILNNKNTLTVLPPGAGKSLCFQLPSLVNEGLTIVISPLLALITDQITKLPPCLSGACLSSFTNQKQRNEIFDAIKNNKIKILFTTPERFAIENFSEIDQISMICFDEAACAAPLAPNFRSAYVSTVNIIKKLKPNVLLFLANNLTILLEENLKSQYKIDEVVKEKISLPKNVRVYISKEDNKLASLIKLLRSSQYKTIGSTIIFCNTKKNVDKVTSYLNQNGMSASSYHSGKSEVERQMIQANFMTDKIKIIICTMAFSMGISKNDIRLVLLYDMPPNVEHFIQQVGRGGRDRKETFVHIFLNDEDYFIQRNMIYMENIDKSQIMKFLDHFVQCVSPVPRNQKRNFSEAFENKPIVGDNVNLSLPKTISLNFTSAADYCGIKKQTQLYLILALLNNKLLNIDETICADNTSKLNSEIKPKSMTSESGNKINSNLVSIEKNKKSEEENQTQKVDDASTVKLTSLGIGPSVINLRFYKSSPEKLAESEANMKILLEASRDYQGVKRFNTLEVCEKIGISYTDLINYLYHLQSRSEIGYETKDEGIFLNVSKLPDSFKEIMTFLHARVQYLINLNLKKLNAAYVLIRKFAANSFEQFLHKGPISGQGVTNINTQNMIKCLNTYGDYLQYENDFRTHFENYFEIEDGIKF
jgi:RecQ family ATP-dependent DNA helicase